MMDIYREIVLVDDSEADNVYHQIIIEQSGLASSTNSFQHAPDALDYLRDCKDQPDLIFLDINMPTLNGFEFLDAVEKQLTHLRSKIIMLTTSDNPKDQRRAKSYNRLSGYLKKPLTLESLSSIKASSNIYITDE